MSIEEIVYYNFFIEFFIACPGCPRLPYLSLLIFFTIL